MKKSIHLLAIATACLIVTSCTKKEQKNEVNPIKVKTVVAAAAGTSAEQPYVGVVEEETSIAVSFQSAGMVKRILVDEGQQVRKGQLIAELDETQAANALDIARAKLNQAIDAEARMKQLHESNSLPEMKWVEIESQVQQAKASYAMSKKALDDCKLYAPASGIVGVKTLNAGENAAPGQPVMTLLDITRVKVKVSIPEKEYAGVTSSTPSTIRIDALDGMIIKGGNIEKGVKGDLITHTYDIKISIANTGGKLLPGMVCAVGLNSPKIAQRSASLAVPITSVQRSADGSMFVWLAKDGKAHRQNVSIGQSIGNLIAIESGLTGGERIITVGCQNLSEGSKIEF